MYLCYIDESGDEGIGTGGSRWFILGALVVPANRDLQVSKMVTRIKTRLGKPDKWPLHWKRIKKHEQRLYICDQLLTEQYSFMAVAADKEHPQIKLSHLRAKWFLYFSSARCTTEVTSFTTSSKERFFSPFCSV